MQQKCLLIWLITLLVWPSLVNADSICQIQGGGALDDLVTQFGYAATNWQREINPLAKKIFFTLFAMEFMWQLTVKKVFAGDVEKLWVFFFTRVTLCFFFAQYLINISLYQGIIAYILQLGNHLGNFSLNIAAGQNFLTLGPSEVISHFACVADSIHKLTDNTGSFEYITTKLSLAILQVMLFIILIFIAYCLIKVILQTYFLLYAGFLLAGFAGSSWTINFWQKYLQAIAAVAIKLFTICLILGVLNVQMQGWANLINKAEGISQLAGLILKVTGSSLIIALATYQLPEWAAMALAGQVNIYLNHSITSLAGILSGSNTTTSSTNMYHGFSKSLGGSDSIKSSFAFELNHITSSGQGLNQVIQGENNYEPTNWSGYKQILQPVNNWVNTNDQQILAQPYLMPKLGGAKNSFATLVSSQTTKFTKEVN